MTPQEAQTVQPPRWIAWTAFATGILMTFDGVATYVAVEILGIATEANPLLASFAESVGFGPTILIRTALILALLVGLWRAAASTSSRRLADIGQTGLRVLCVVYGVLAAVHVAGTVWAFLP